MEAKENLSKRLMDLSERVKSIPAEAEHAVLEQIESIAATIKCRMNDREASDRDKHNNENADRVTRCASQNGLPIHVKIKNEVVDDESPQDWNGDVYSGSAGVRKTWMAIKGEGDSVIQAEVTTEGVPPAAPVEPPSELEDVKDIEKECVKIPGDEFYEQKKKSRCLVCRKKFPCAESAREHMRRDHNMILSVGKAAREAVTLGSASQQTADDSVDFDELIRLELEEHACPECGVRTKSEIGLKQHMAKHHASVLPTKCHDCNKEYNNYKKLLAHRRACHGDRVYLCSQCSYTTKHSIDLKRHVMMRHGKYEDYPYQCTVCLKRFVMPNTLKKHIKVHEENRPVLHCDHEGCDFKTRSESSLQFHVRKHKGLLKSYTCSICGVTLGAMQTYKTHMRRHNGEMPYACQTCPASFPCNAQLVAHERIHGEKTETCPTCGKKFIDKPKVKRHMLVHTHEKKHSCPWCPYKCGIDSNLRKHCAAKHNELYPPKVRHKVSARAPRHGAAATTPARAKPRGAGRGQGRSEIAQSIVMALSKANPGRLFTMAAGDSGDAQPVLYLDTTNNQIVLRTENSDPSLESQPKFTLREENGEYHLVQLPAAHDTQSFSRVHTAPVLLSADNTGGIKTDFEQKYLPLSQGASLSQHAAPSLGHDAEVSLGQQPEGSLGEPSGYEQAVEFIERLEAEQAREEAACLQYDIQASLTVSPQSRHASPNVDELSTLAQGAVLPVEEPLGAGDRQLVLNEEALQRLSQVPDGGMVLVQQPDGSTYEIQLRDNQYSVRHVADKVEDSAMDEGVSFEDSNGENIVDPSQYFQTFQSPGVKPDSGGGGDHQFSNVSFPTSAGGDKQNSNVINSAIAHLVDSMAGTENSEYTFANTAGGESKGLTILRSGGTLSVVYANNEVNDNPRNAQTVSSNVGFGETRDITVINPQDFVNKV